MTRFDRTVLTAIVLASGLAVAGYLYAQTATLKGKQVRVIDATDATINLHTSDSSGVNLVESRLLNGNEYEFYTGSSVSTAVEFISGITTWMDLSSPGLVSVQPRFPVGFSLQGSFLSTAGGGFGGRITSTVTDATEAYSIESSDSNKDWYILGDTSMCWGDPTCDTDLYRSAADTLRTSDSLTVDADLIVSGVFRPTNIGAFPASTCTAGEIWIDTDQTDDTNCTTAADNSLCLCTMTDTWTALENN